MHTWKELIFNQKLNIYFLSSHLFLRATTKSERWVPGVFNQCIHHFVLQSLTQTTDCSPPPLQKPNKKTWKMEKKLNNSTSNQLKTLYTSDNKTWHHCQSSLSVTLIDCRKDRTENNDAPTILGLTNHKNTAYILGIIWLLFFHPPFASSSDSPILQKWFWKINTNICPNIWPFGDPGVNSESSFYHVHSAFRVLCFLSHLINKVRCKWSRAK